MNTYTQAVLSHFKSEDFKLGLRSILDLIMDTQSQDMYRLGIKFCELFYSQKEEKELIKQEASTLLAKLDTIGLKHSTMLSKELVSLHGVNKQYRNSTFGLYDLNISLKTGEIIGLVGENGNGKTTFLKLIAGILKPNSGTIEYGINASDSYELQSQIQYLDQRLPKSYGKLTDNLQFILSHYGIYGSENDLLTELMLYRLDLHPYKNSTWNQISGGYKTRFALASVLLQRPPILLLDEPLANLDIRSQQTLLQDIKAIAQSPVYPMGVIISSQHIYEVEKISDSVVFLKEGKAIVESSKGNNEVVQDLVVELELPKHNKMEVEKLFSALDLKQIQYNGGVYMLHFSELTTPDQVLHMLLKNQVPVQYYRNISKSSSRFFFN